MADPRLAAWRAAAEAATEPPWTWGWLDGTAMTETYTVRRADPACEVLARTSRYKQGYEDAEFIAAARTAVPVLLDLVDRLEAENQQLRDEKLAALKLLRYLLHHWGETEPRSWDEFYDDCIRFLRTQGGV